MAINNITIADQARIDLIISLLAKYGINAPIHIQKENAGYWFIFEDEVSLLALTNFVAKFNSINRGMLEIDWDANMLYFQIPSIWD